jgi:hypothetical protein
MKRTASSASVEAMGFSSSLAMSAAGQCGVNSVRLQCNHFPPPKLNHKLPGMNSIRKALRREPQERRPMVWDISRREGPRKAPQLLPAPYVVNRSTLSSPLARCCLTRAVTRCGTGIECCHDLTEVNGDVHTNGGRALRDPQSKRGTH